MSLKIRLTRMGSRHRPFYRLVVAESRVRRDGRVVDTLGFYNPLPLAPEVKVEQGKTLDWLRKGAQASETARSLLKQTGIWQRFQLLKQGKSEEEVEAAVANILAARRQAKAPAVAVSEQPSSSGEAAAEVEAVAKAEPVAAPAKEDRIPEAPAAELQPEPPKEEVPESAPPQESPAAEQGSEQGE